MRVPREQLYEEVWQLPMTAVAAKYGISSVALKKTCKRLHIPVPRRGHWQRVARGLVVERLALPPVEPGHELEWVRGEQRLPSRAPWPLPQAPSNRSRASAQSSPDATEHPLVAAARPIFGEGRLAPDTEYLRPLKLSLDLVVSKPALESALVLASGLFRFLERRSYRVLVAANFQPIWRKPFDHTMQRQPEHLWLHGAHRPTVVLVGTVAFGLTIFEPMELRAGRYGADGWVPLSALEVRLRKVMLGDSLDERFKQLMPSGRLGVRLYSPYGRVDAEWLFDEAKANGRFFKKVLATLEAEAPAIAAKVAAEDQRQRTEQVEAERRHEEYQRRREEEQRREAEARRLQAIEQSRQNLLRLIHGWGEACLVSNFLHEVQAEVDQLPEPQRLAVAQRLERARQLFANTSPLAQLAKWQPPPR